MAIKLTSTIPTRTRVGVAYTQNNAASGGTPTYTYSVSSGTLPAGMTLNTSTGAVSGTPTTSGPYQYAITVSDSLAATATRTVNGVIGPAVGAMPTASSPSLALIQTPTSIRDVLTPARNTQPAGSVAVYYSVDGGPIRRAAGAIDMPPGLHTAKFYLGDDDGNYTLVSSSASCDPFWQYVYLLDHFEGLNGSAVILDSSQYNRTAYSAANCSLTTAGPLVGGASLSLSGSNSRLTYTKNQGAMQPDFLFTGDFTVEVTFNQAAAKLAGLVTNYCSIGTDVHNGLFLGVGADQHVQTILYSAGAVSVNVSSTPGAFALSTKVTVAFSRVGGTAYLLVNGVLVASGAAGAGQSTNPLFLYDFLVGRDPGAGGAGNVGDRDFNGLIDEVRVTMAGRYTGNYTVVLPYPDHACG